MIVTIERLGHLGDAIGQGVFVSGALPGEIVEGEVHEGRIAAPRILTPSPDRVRPPCPHARSCGGCLLQHASDGFAERWKQEVVRSALAGQGLEAPFRPMAVSPPATRRRAVLSGRRTKGGALVGFHARQSGTIIPIPECKLLHPDLMQAIPALEALVRAAGSRSGELSLTVTRSLGGPDVAVTGGKALDAPLRAELARIAEERSLARLTWDGETIALRVPPAQAFGAARVVPPPGAFLQATAEGEAALLAAVRDAIGEARTVTDLFAGVGTFALPLAAAAEVHAVEGDAAMTAALDRGWRQAQGLKRVTAETRDLFRRPLEPDELRRAEAVVIDPPRAGAEAQGAALARARVPVIAFVSCNPVTFARDAALLVRAGYRLDWVQVVDQFRWSAHVELAARLSLPA
ncbi:class I SAM-dependent RNA methyltransferase [Cereibacter sediminicola]|uniref:class I SAM-dependent RNA methyltransferase n=1 Tax=Cereibacter sediminicola TaxID=2584941 RepID=UPI0011A1BDF6|nr:class I SAM-dependent RNA methyltransferase [Cereibacter sediminicola]